MSPFLKRAAALTACIALGACGRDTDSHKEVPAPAKAEAQAPEGPIKLTSAEVTGAGIKVVPLAEIELQDRFVVTANVRPNEDRFAHVAPRVPGRLVRVDAKLGDKVRAGQTLAVLDSVEVGEAHAAYLQALSEAGVSRTAFERADRLYKEEVIPAKEFQRVRADNEKAQASLRAAADRLRLLGTQPKGEVGQPAVSMFPLTAPNAGTVVEKHAVLGEVAKPDASLFTIADLQVVWVEADIAEKDLARMRAGAQAAITVAAYPGETFAGRVTYVGTVLDKDTRTVRSRIEAPNPSGKLVPGMFASATILGGNAKRVLAVPDSAVTLIDGAPVVFVEVDGGYDSRAVQIGERTAGMAVIQGGLKPGDRAVVQGAFALKARKLKSQIGDSH